MRSSVFQILNYFHKNYTIRSGYISALWNFLKFENKLNNLGITADFPKSRESFHGCYPNLALISCYMYFSLFSLSLEAALIKISSWCMLLLSLKILDHTCIQKFTLFISPQQNNRKDSNWCIDKIGRFLHPGRGKIPDIVQDLW